MIYRIHLIKFSGTSSAVTHCVYMEMDLILLDKWLLSHLIVEGKGKKTPNIWITFAYPPVPLFINMV